MKKLLQFATLAFALATSFAHAQPAGQLQAGQIWGNPTSQPKTATGTSVGAVIDQFYSCSARGDLLARGASAWTCFVPGTSGKPLVSAGPAADLTWATLTVFGGGTGLAAGTSGGVPYFNSTSTMASSALLTANQLILGGGAGAAPASLGSLGTTTTLLHGNAGGAPTFGAVVSADLNITTTTCSNQFLTAISATGTGTCTTDTLAGAQHANQGTTTTVLHGNAAGNPSWAAVALGTDVSGTLGLTNGGAGGSLTASNGGVVYSDASRLQLLSGTATPSQCLLSGANSAPSWGSCAGGASVLSIAGNTGAFTLANGIDNSTNQIQLTAARRTLPTIQTFTSGTNATYTTPANVLWIEVYMVGGGAGGGGGANASASTAGNPTCWKSSGTACSTPDYQAGGGGTASASGPGTGGTVSGASTCNLISATGGGGSASAFANGTVGGIGAAGGNSYLGGGGAGSNTTGVAGGTNTGGGGGGGVVSGAGTNTFGGMGGGAGATCAVIINSPAATYVYTVGSTAAGAAGGTNGSAGGTGAAGKIWVIEHYGT